MANFLGETVFLEQKRVVGRARVQLFLYFAEPRLFRLEAQLALIRAGLASLDQIFLPFAQDVSGATLYERIKEQRFATLTLGGSR